MTHCGYLMKTLVLDKPHVLPCGKISLELGQKYNFCNFAKTTTTVIILLLKCDEKINEAKSIMTSPSLCIWKVAGFKQKSTILS